MESAALFNKFKLFLAFTDMTNTVLFCVRIKHVQAYVIAVHTRSP